MEAYYYQCSMLKPLIIINEALIIFLMEARASY